MIKRLLKRIFSLQTISIVIAIILLFLSLFAASKLEINKETGILTGILAFTLILIFFASLFFICSMAVTIAKEKQEQTEKK